MSNRTLIEINHDHWSHIKDRPQQFADAVCRYLGSGSVSYAEELEYYGIRVFGMRHHTDAFDITWGFVKANQKESPKR